MPLPEVFYFPGKSLSHVFSCLIIGTSIPSSLT